MSTKPVIKVERMTHVNDGIIKATCDLLILDTFMVKGIKIVEGREMGLGEDTEYIEMPGEFKDGKLNEMFYPVSREMRKGLEELILEEWAEGRQYAWDGENNG